MAFIQKFGNLPIVGNVYNVQPTDQLWSSGYFAFQSVIQQSTDRDTAIYIVNHGFDCGLINAESWGTSHKSIGMFPIKSADVTQQPNTSIWIKASGYHSSFGTYVVDFAIQANEDLDMPSDIACGGTFGGSGLHLFGLAVAIHTGAEAASLNSVGIFYFAVVPSDPQGFYNLDSSYAYTRLSLSLLRDMGYDVGLPIVDPILGPESEPNGYGQDGIDPSFDYDSVPIEIPDMPTIGCTTAGFYHAYRVSQGTLNDFGSKLFPTLGEIAGDMLGIDTPTDAIKVLLNLLAVPNLFNQQEIVGQRISILDILMNGKAIDYVVDCHVIPVNPAVGASAPIKCGIRELDISAPVITSDYIDFDCGSVSTPLTYTNFMDFAGGARARLFLPFVGFVDLKPEYWHGGTISVKYRFNIVDGSFMAYVYSQSGVSQLSSVIGQFGGCACIHIPVTGVSYASMVSGMVSGSMALVGGAASGNVAGAVGGALTLANMQPTLASSNNYNASTSFLGVRRPYLLIERAVPSMSAMYPHSKGFPLNVAMTIGSVHGYTEIEDVDLSGLDYTQEEIEELRSLLAGGVYL